MEDCIYKIIEFARLKPILLLTSLNKYFYNEFKRQRIKFIKRIECARKLNMILKNIRIILCFDYRSTLYTMSKSFDPKGSHNIMIIWQKQYNRITSTFINFKKNTKPQKISYINSIYRLSLEQMIMWNPSKQCLALIN